MKKILALVATLYCGHALAQSNLTTVQQSINSNIRANGANAITGTVLNSVLNLMAISTPTMIGNIGGDCSGVLPTLVCTKSNGVTFSALATSSDAVNLTGTVPTIALGNTINAIGYVPANIATDLSQFAATTSTQLRGVISDETGTGSLAFATSPTLAGTPLSTTAAVDTNTTQIATTAYVIGQNYLKKSGGTLTGNLILDADPTLALGAATKSYVDASASAGINVHTAVIVKTTANLTATYNNGAGTLTNSGALAAISIDSVSLSLTNRVLVNNQTNTFENGIYTVTTVGSGAAAWVLTRATDFDTVAAGEVASGAYTLVTSGTTFNNSSWLFSYIGVITIGTSDLTFGQFSGPTTGYAPIASPTFTGVVTVPNGSALGAPASINLSNGIALPLASGVTGTLAVANGGTGITSFGTGVAAALGQNVTGTGGIVRATSPTLATASLATPTIVNPGITGGTMASTALSGVAVSGSSTWSGGTIDTTRLVVTSPTLANANSSICAIPAPIYYTTVTNSYCINPITTSFGALDNSAAGDHRIFGTGPACDVNSASFKGELFCQYSSLIVNSIAAASAAGENQFTSSFSFANGKGNVTSTNAGIFAGNDNLAVEGTGWTYAVGREIDVTLYQPVANKMALRITLAGPDAYQGSTQDGAIVAINQPGAIGWKNFILLDATSGNIPVLNANGCILCITGAVTINKGIDFSGWTLTGNAFASTGFAIGNNGSSVFTGSSAGFSPLGFVDTNTGGNTWYAGPGVGTASASEWNIYNATTTTTIAQFSNAGVLNVAVGYKAAGSTGVTKICTSLPTVVGGIITAC
jgi:hypothetical protein